MNQRLRSRRRALDITQKEIALTLGIDQTYYSKIERGNKIPRIDLAWKISQALAMPLEDLFPAEVFFISSTLSSKEQAQ